MFQVLDSCINHHRSKLLDTLLQTGLRTVSLSAESKNNLSGIHYSYDGDLFVGVDQFSGLLFAELQHTSIAYRHNECHLLAF